MAEKKFAVSESESDANYFAFVLHFLASNLISKVELINGKNLLSSFAADNLLMRFAELLFSDGNPLITSTTLRAGRHCQQTATCKSQEHLLFSKAIPVGS